MSSTPTRAWRGVYAANAAVAAFALIVKFADAATSETGHFHTVVGRLFDEACYFTIQSNIIVLLVSVALAARPAWRWVGGAPRLTGLVCITITSVVYYALLAADQHYTGIAAVADVLAHLVSPVLFVGTWLLDRHTRFERRHAAQMLLFPAFWIGLTLIRGAIVHVYPYDFVDVMVNGYAAVVSTIAALTAVAALLAFSAVALDRRRAPRYSIVP
jgi:hypothetical protein